MRRLSAILIITVTTLLLVAVSGIVAIQSYVQAQEEKGVNPLAAIFGEPKPDHSQKVGGDIISSLEFPADVTEDFVINTMHKMTHQKVKADQKWGAVEMTPENIEKIYKALQNSDFVHKKDLFSIAERWRAGDFSKADSDHNFLWRLQGGNVGKAEGLMSEEEERLFIENNFRKDKQ